MEKFEKVIISKYKPKDKHVLWIDISKKVPVMKIFINGQWKVAESNELTPEQIQEIISQVPKIYINGRELEGYQTTEDLGIYAIVEENNPMLLAGKYLIDSNCVNKLGNITSNFTIRLNSTTVNTDSQDIYYFTFTVPSTVVGSVTMTCQNAEITWLNDDEPQFEPGKYYEVSIMDNYGLYASCDLQS